MVPAPKPRPMWTLAQLDIMLENMLQMKHIPVPDEAGNDKAIANAVAHGVKIRDFGVMKNMNTKNKATPSNGLDGIPEIFRAHEKALLFHYMRWLFSRNIFDIPHVSLTVEDVDRLFTLGFITRDCNFTLGRAMLAHGAYRRALRGTGKPTYYGKILPERGAWTVAASARPPTQMEIDWFIHCSEEARMREYFDGEYSVYWLWPCHRPLADLDWRQHRSAYFGLFGLKHARLSDEMATAYINTPDPSFIHPQVFCPPVPVVRDCPSCRCNLNSNQSMSKIIVDGREMEQAMKLEDTSTRSCGNMSPEKQVSEVNDSATDINFDNGSQDMRQKRPREIEDQDQEKHIHWQNASVSSTKRSKTAINGKCGDDHQSQTKIQQ